MAYTNEKNRKNSVIASEMLLASSNNHWKVASIINQDPFLSYWSEKTLIEKQQLTHKIPTKRIYYQGNWAELNTQILSQDLFTNSSLFIIEFAKPSQLNNQNIDLMLEKLSTKTKNKALFILKETTMLQQKKPWFQSLLKYGNIYSTKTIPTYKIPTWFQHLCQYYKQKIPSQLCTKLCHTLEFDLSSLEQCLIQMKIQENNTPPSNLKDLEKFILSTSTPSQIYAHLDNIYQGNIQKTKENIPKYQQTEQVANLYWLAIKRLRQILQIKENISYHKKTASEALQKAKIWPKQHSMYLKILKVPQQKLIQHYMDLCELEWVLKGHAPGDFTSLTQLKLSNICNDIFYANT